MDINIIKTKIESLVKQRSETVNKLNELSGLIKETESLLIAINGAVAVLEDLLRIDGENK